MPDPLVLGARYEQDFTWLYASETGYSILVEWKDTIQVYNIIFLNNILLHYTKNAYNQRGFSNVTFRIAS